MSLHATSRHRAHTALNNSVKQIAGNNAGVRIYGGLARNIGGRIKVECLLLLLSIGPEQTNPETQIQSQRLVTRQSSWKYGSKIL